MTLSEAEFTKPHADCPNPGLWTAADAYSTECEVTDLLAAFVRALQPEYVVETGSCWGQTTEAIGSALDANGHGRLVSLELDSGKAAYTRDRCAGLPVEVVQGSSLDFTPERPIDFAFFDSDMQLRLTEFGAFKDWLAVGTVVAFHDTSPHMGALGFNVEADYRLRCIRLRTPRGITFAEVVR